MSKVPERVARTLELRRSAATTPRDPKRRPRSTDRAAWKKEWR